MGAKHVVTDSPVTRKESGSVGSGVRPGGLLVLAAWLLPPGPGSQARSPIPTHWLLGGTPLLGRGMVPRLQEMGGQEETEERECMRMRTDVHSGGGWSPQREAKAARKGVLRDTTAHPHSPLQSSPTAHMAESSAQGPGRDHIQATVRVVTGLMELRGCRVGGRAQVGRGGRPGIL